MINQIKLTQKEHAALMAIHHTSSLMAGDGCACWSSEVMSGAYTTAEIMGLIGSKKSFSGLCSSLQKKGLIKCDESCGDDTVCVTVDGLVVIRNDTKQCVRT